MNKNTRLILATISLLFIGCIKKHKFTANVCNGQFCVEDFNINPAGVDELYMTDSLNFKVYVGKFDKEHKNFSFKYNGDSIIVMKLSGELKGPKMTVVESRNLS